MQKAYMCDYCNMISSRKDIKVHEKSCKYNPTNRTCMTCTYSITDYDNILCCMNQKTDIISISFFMKAILRENCEYYQRGTPTMIKYV